MSRPFPMMMTMKMAILTVLVLYLELSAYAPQRLIRIIIIRLSTVVALESRPVNISEARAFYRYTSPFTYYVVLTDNAAYTYTHFL